MCNRSQNQISDVPNRHWITESVPAAAGELGRVGFLYHHCNILTSLKATTTTGIFNFSLWSAFSSSTAPHFSGVTARANKHTFKLVFHLKIQKAGKFMSAAGRYIWPSFGNEHWVINYFSSTGQTIELCDSYMHIQYQGAQFSWNWKMFPKNSVQHDRIIFWGRCESEIYVV